MGFDVRGAKPGDGETKASAYWDAVIDQPDTDGGGPAWRAFCDRLHEELLDRWLGGRRFSRALKTDLFDEVCGVGLAGALARRSEAVHGVDVSARVAVSARRRALHLRSSVADARRLAYRSDSFDLVLSNSTLDHFAASADIDAALAELHRVMAPGAHLVVTLDNPLNPVVALRYLVPARLLHRLFLVPYYTGATLTLERLSAALRRAGFDLQERGTLMHVPRLPAIRLCRWIDRGRTESARARWLRGLAGWERLGSLPTRQITAYYVAAHATKPMGGSP